GVGLYGREHARAIDGRLREVLLPYWNPHSQHVAQVTARPAHIADSDPASRSSRVILYVVPGGGVAAALPLRDFVSACHLLKNSLQTAAALMTFFDKPKRGPDPHIHAHNFAADRN